jgi:hypothetical protein
LSQILAEKPQNGKATIQSAIQPYKRFVSRIRQPRGKPSWNLGNAQNDLIKADPAIQRYLRDLGSRRGNNGIVSDPSIQFTTQSVKQFLAYTGIEISDHAISDLVEYKRNNLLSTDIELALTDYSNEPPIKYHRGTANRILGIFRANFARLDARISNHFTPPAENCSVGTFREIFNHLTQYQQGMIQWGTYVPERARTAYRVPFSDIDLSRSDFAIVQLHGTTPSEMNLRTKARVDHPAFPPIDFARNCVARAQAAGYPCLFPNHSSEWKKITKFAQEEYGVNLNARYLRKFFEDTAEETSIPVSVAAFLMGDKGKLARSGHLPEHYNLKIRFIETMITKYKESGLPDLLWLFPIQANNTPESANNKIHRLEQELARLKKQLSQE